MKKLKFLLSVLVSAIFITPVFAYTPPSTNDTNRTNGWAHVDEVNKDIGEVTLHFIQPRNFASCFEYRTDGDTTQFINEIHPLETFGVVPEGDPLQEYPSFCLDTIGNQTETIEARKYVEVRLMFGAEGDERFDWTRFDVLTPDYPPLVTIESPLEGEHVDGILDIYGTILEDVAMRNYSVAIFEEADGYEDLSLIKESTNTRTTSGFDNQLIYQWDTTAYSEGDYWIRFAARDLAGHRDLSGNPLLGGDDSQHVIKVTVGRDFDDDTVLNDDDFCPNTKSDLPTLLNDLGVNRHIWTGKYEKYLTTLVPGKKGQKVPKASMFTIEDVRGCSCNQILDLIKKFSGDEMLGHYKFGCSKSIIEDFILDMKDDKPDGKYLLDEFNVPGDNESGIISKITTTLGAHYVLESSGTYRFASWGDNGVADAMYSLRPNGIWVLGSNLPYPYTDYLSLRVNGSPVSWVGTYMDPEHIYTLDYIGTGNPIHFNIEDGGTTGDNSGNLHVKIFVQL